MHCTAILLFLINGIWSSVMEKKLYLDLKTGYERLERPVRNSSEPIVVQLALTLNSIVDVNEKDQIITLNSWPNYIWNDYNMIWDPKEYDGVSAVRFPFGTLWNPDVLLYNSVDSDFDSTYKSNLVAYSDGKINWIPPGIFQLSCKIDITWFPFDEQRCYYKFGSWTYDGTKLDLQPDGIGWDLSEFIENGEWYMYKTSVRREEKYYECCPEPYPSLFFDFYMKRRTLYYAFNLIIPCILITMITILGFMLPPDSGEKIGLQITVMLSISFFLEIVSSMSPATSEAVPLLSIFFSTCMITVSASVFMTVIVLNIHHRNADTHDMGDWTRYILLELLPWLLMMSRPGQKTRKSDIVFNNFIQIYKNKSMVDKEPDGKSEPSWHTSRSSSGEANLNVECRIHKCLRSLATSQELSRTDQAVLMILQRMYMELCLITKQITSKEEASEKRNEWRFAAMVIDRLCLIVFTFFISISTFYIFFTAPYLST